MSGIQEERRHVRVTIGGIELQLAADVDEKIAREVADHVNRRYLDIQRAVKGDSIKVALLTAMNIAGELYEQRQSVKEIQNRIDEAL